MLFTEPLNFLFVAVVPLVIWLLIQAQQRRQSSQRRFADDRMFAAIASKERPNMLWAHIVLVGLACLLVVMALARPKGGVVMEELTGEGIDIVFAMDISKSMQAEDIYPNRFRVMKDIAKALVDQNPYDRVGAIAFAGEAFVLCPLTLDHITAKSFIDAMTFEPNIKQGTGIGEAIVTALDRFDSENSRVLILFTDGENNKGVDPIQAAKAAAERGIKIYTVGIGDPSGIQLMQDADPFFGIPRPKMHQGNPVIVKLDEGTLKEVAKITGGEYVSISRDEDIGSAFLHLDKSAKQTFASGSRQVRAELGPWFLAAAAFILAIDFLVELYRVSPLGYSWLKGRSPATPAPAKSAAPARASSR